MEHILKVLSYHGQIDAQISTNSGQIRPKDPQEHKEKLQVPCYSKFSRKEMITSFTWHEMRQFQQPHHYTVCQWGFYPIVKTCKKWVMTLSSSMAMYSVMRDIPDARKVPIERRVALHLYATCKFSNHLTLEQWAFEYGLPLFWYALYIIKCNVIDGLDFYRVFHIPVLCPFMPCMLANTWWYCIVEVLVRTFIFLKTKPEW